MRPAATDVVTVKLPRELARRLRQVARRAGKTQSLIIREGLAWRLDAEPGVPKGSALALAGDLVGAFSGPSDLATHRRHLRGFGK